MLTHEPAIYFTTPIWGRAIGITEIASNSKDSGRPVQTVPSHMATGRWIQYQGGWANGQPPLHERPQMPISRETIRRILARHGLRFLTGQTWCQSTDPEFEVKKTL